MHTIKPKLVDEPRVTHAGMKSGSGFVSLGNGGRKRHIRPAL